ncbi:hypothetical protein Tdes44962_MAKER02901, partial [Teratosphaeria destructans]
ACLKLLPDLVTVRLLVHTPIKTHREDDCTASQAARLADFLFCKLYPTCSHLKAGISAGVADGRTSAAAEDKRPELIKHYVRPCDVLEDDVIRSAWGWSSR